MPDAPTRPCYVASCSHVRPCPVHGMRQRRPWNQHRWRVLARAFLRRHPFCVACRAARRVTLATDVDHVVAHKGDDGLFWDEANWQALCARCHGLKTKREEARGGV